MSKERRNQLMPVLEATDRLAPRSALRHRPLQQEPATPEHLTELVGVSPSVARASRPRPAQPDAASAEVAEWKRLDAPEKQDGRGTATRKSRSRQATMGSSETRAKPEQGTAPTANGGRPGPSAAPRSRFHAHPLLYLGLGMLCMLALWCLLLPAISWVHTTLDDLRYGRPRTFQIDAFVGHDETAGLPSHFIALNLNGRIEIIELPGGDGSHARIYSGPQLYGPEADLVPVTLSFADVNGDHKPDMIVHFQETRIVFLNDGQAFRPLRADERPAVLQFLQRHPNL
jgi:hypothetical protein